MGGQFCVIILVMFLTLLTPEKLYKQKNKQYWVFRFFFDNASNTHCQVACTCIIYIIILYFSIFLKYVCFVSKMRSGTNTVITIFKHCFVFFSKTKLIFWKFCEHIKDNINSSLAVYIRYSNTAVFFFPKQNLNFENLLNI